LSCLKKKLKKSQPKKPAFGKDWVLAFLVTYFDCLINELVIVHYMMFLDMISVGSPRSALQLAGAEPAVLTLLYLMLDVTNYYALRTTLSWHTSIPVECLTINAEKEINTRMHKTIKKDHNEFRCWCLATYISLSFFCY
jgi:hypothetical protein